MRIPQDLPTIPWVDELIWSDPGFYRNFHEIRGVGLMKLASRFNGLTYFEASLGDDHNHSEAFIGDYHNNPVQVRSNLAREMSHLSLSRLSEFVFNFDGPPFYDDSLPNIGSPSSDALSVALYRLLQSPNLLKVNLGDFSHSRGVRVTPELFWLQLKEFRGQNPF